MDYLWSPWRYQYVTTADRAPDCIFCELPRQNRDRENYIVYRGRLNFVILNRFPYTSGHLMIVPYEHVPTLERVAKDTLVEMILLAREAETHLRAQYLPDGLNVGVNVGKAAGAGVAGHIHMHVLPRWVADANFMTSVGETRVLPEDLSVTYQKLLQNTWGNDQDE
ncbi:MAG TPA: HIT domain-containing protein [Bryobacteraceae bacterium]|nr:HIT domain-containing protein [Bryobacteraceae bacterium]